MPRQLMLPSGGRRALRVEWFDHSDSCGPQISNNISQDSSESEDFIVLKSVFSCFFCPNFFKMARKSAPPCQSTSRTGPFLMLWRLTRPETNLLPVRKHWGSPNRCPVAKHRAPGVMVCLFNAGITCFYCSISQWEKRELLYAAA